MTSRAALLTLLCLLVPALSAPARAEPPRTVAETSDYKATSRHADVVDFCERLAKESPLVRLGTLGTSQEGASCRWSSSPTRPSPAPAEAQKSKKLVVFAMGNIHAGEVDGKEALLMLARDIATAKERPLLKELVLVFAPIFNADGNEKISKDNRPEQAGPAERRRRARQRPGLRPQSRLRQAGKSGSAFPGPLPQRVGPRRLHRLPHDQRLVPPLHDHLPGRPLPRRRPARRRPGARRAAPRRRPASGEGGRLPLVLLRQLLGRPHAAGRRCRRRRATAPSTSACATASPSCPSRTPTPPSRTASSPRVPSSRQSANIPRRTRRSLTKLWPTPATIPPAPARSRSRATRSCCARSRRRSAGRSRCSASRKRSRTASASRPAGRRSTRSSTSAAPSRRCPSPGRMPTCFPATSTAVVDTLQRHGITVEELREDIELDVEAYRIDRVTRVRGVSEAPAGRAGRDGAQGVARASRPARSSSARASRWAASLPTCWSRSRPTAWPRGTSSTRVLKEGKDFPVLRLPAAAPLTAGRVRPLAEERTLNKPITFEVLYGRGAAAQLQRRRRCPASPGSTTASTSCKARTAGSYKVDALTGRCQPFLDADKLASALAALPTIDPAGGPQAGGHRDGEPQPAAHRRRCSSTPATCTIARSTAARPCG